MQERELAQPPSSVPEYVRRPYRQNEPISAEESPAASPLPTLPHQPQPPRPRKARLERQQRRANNEPYGRSDPEASVIWRQGFGLHLAYKAHLAMAAKRGRFTKQA